MSSCTPDGVWYMVAISLKVATRETGETIKVAIKVAILHTDSSTHTA